MTAAVAHTPVGRHNPNADRTQPVSIPNAPFVPPAALYRVPAELAPMPVALGHTTPPWTRTPWANALEQATAPRRSARTAVLLVLTLLLVLGAAATALVLFVL
ncbi:hypothetical protein [Amycolatopsis anabasis]|uniref:hypothetical protein n=1 Tax=Amycolatopsis anabasis TaxID=1840409 RepID=UPI00131B10AB|nr:hypothetical protein [Amycolatopsis anabasis]